MVGNRLTIQLNGLNNLIQIIGNRDGAVCEGGPADSAASQDAIKFVLIGCVVGNRRGGILKLVPGEDTDHTLVGLDDSFLTQAFGSGHAGRAGRLAAQTSGSDLGFGVKDLLIRHISDRSVANFERA